MQYSCCSPSKYYYDVQNNGYDSIVLSATELVTQTKREFQNTYEMVMNGKIPCNSCNDFSGSNLRLCGNGFDLQAVLDYAALLAERSSVLHIKNIGIGAPLSRMIPAGYEKKRARHEFMLSFNAIADQLSAAGVTALLEAVSVLHCNLIQTTREALEFAKELKRSDIGLVYDIYHASVMHEDPLNYLEAADFVQIIHIAHGVNGERHHLKQAHYAEYEKYFSVIRQHPAKEVAIEACSSAAPEQLSNSLSIMRALGQGNACMGGY